MEYLPLLLDALERVSNVELTNLIKATVRNTMRVGTQETAQRMCRYLEDGQRSWHTKTLVLPMLTSVVCNMFPEADAVTIEATIKQLEDARAEVQQAASATLTRLARLGVLKGIPQLLDEFMARARTFVRRVKRRPVAAGAKIGPEHRPLSVEEKAQQRRKHSGVLGIAAVVLAHPYDMPEWMPRALVQLAAHTTDVQAIKSVPCALCSEACMCFECVCVCECE